MITYYLITYWIYRMKMYIDVCLWYFICILCTCHTKWVPGGGKRSTGCYFPITLKWEALEIEESVFWKKHETCRLNTICSKTYFNLINQCLSANSIISISSHAYGQFRAGNTTNDFIFFTSSGFPSAPLLTNHMDHLLFFRQQVRALVNFSNITFLYW